MAVELFTGNSTWINTQNPDCESNSVNVARKIDWINDIHWSYISNTRKCLQKYIGWPFLIRSSIQLAVTPRGGPSTASTQELAASLSRICAYNHFSQAVKLTFSSWLSYNPPHSVCTFMLLFKQQLALSFEADCTAPPPSISSSTCKGGIPCMCSAVPLPPRSHILPSSSNIHPLSLSLRDHYCQYYDWPEHRDGCMVLLFQGFF